MPTNGLSTKPLKVKLLAGEQKATELNISRSRQDDQFPTKRCKSAHLWLVWTGCLEALYKSQGFKPHTHQAEPQTRDILNKVARVNTGFAYSPKFARPVRRSQSVAFRCDDQLSTFLGRAHFCVLVERKTLSQERKAGQLG